MFLWPTVYNCDTFIRQSFSCVIFYVIHPYTVVGSLNLASVPMLFSEQLQGYEID